VTFFPVADVRALAERLAGAAQHPARSRPISAAEIDAVNLAAGIGLIHLLQRIAAH